MPIDSDTSAIVCAIAEVESGGVNRPGDNGRALSVYQIHEGFWLDCEQFIRHRPELGLSVGDNWRDIAGDDATSKARAHDTCAAGVLLIKHWLESHGQVPTPGLIYAAYTEGRQKLLNCDFDINHGDFPHWKRGKCARVAQLVQEQDKHGQ